MLRSTLKSRYGSRGGVARIYRLLSEVRTEQSVARQIQPAEILERDLEAMRERAERAEQREEVHQSRWAVEVDYLRGQMATLEPLAQQAKASLETVGLLRRQLRVAEARIAMLEQQLLEEGEGRGQSRPRR